MRFSCESCGAQYMISDEKVGPGGVKVRCKKCGNVIPVRRAVGAPSDVAAAGAAGGASASGANVEVDVDRDLEQAFQNVLGGGSMAGGAPDDLGAAPPEPNAVSDAELATEWYVAIDDRQVGPIPPSGVRSRWEVGEIGPDTLAWRAGMADWSPLASIPEMTRYLAGAATRTAATPQTPTNVAVETQSATTAATAASSASNGTNGKLNGHDGWQPGAASALAALAARELTPEKPLPVPGTPGASPPSSGSSLLDRMNLPEGGVDPTNLVPLPMKGVETTEVDLKPRAAEPERTEIRQIRKEAKRSGAAMGVAVALVVAAGIGAALWLFRPVVEEHRAPVAVAVPAAPSAPKSSATAPAPPPQAAAQQPATSPDPAAPVAATAAPAPAASQAPVAAQPPAPSQAPAAAQALAPQPPSPAPPAAAERADRQAAAEPPAAQAPAAAERAPAHRPSKAEAAAARKAARERASAAAPKKPQRVASAEPLARPAAEPAPAPAPAPAVAAAPRHKGGDPLLDVGGDDDLEKELASTKPKRSVYVPPAMGSDLPESVSVSQINEAVVGQKAALLRCIEQQRAADPNTRGTLKVRWLIGGDGAPRDVAVLSDEFAKQPIGTCISGVVKGIRFPRSRTSGQEVVFPFKF